MACFYHAVCALLREDCYGDDYILNDVYGRFLFKAELLEFIKELEVSEDVDFCKLANYLVLLCYVVIIRLLVYTIQFI